MPEYLGPQEYVDKALTQGLGYRLQHLGLEILQLLLDSGGKPGEAVDGQCGLTSLLVLYRKHTLEEVLVLHVRAGAPVLILGSVPVGLHGLGGGFAGSVDLLFCGAQGTAALRFHLRAAAGSLRPVLQGREVLLFLVILGFLLKNLLQVFRSLLCSSM